MHKTFRRTLAFLLVWSVFFTSIPMTAKAEEVEQGELEENNQTTTYYWLITYRAMR